MSQIDKDIKFLDTVAVTLEYNRDELYRIQDALVFVREALTEKETDPAYEAHRNSADPLRWGPRSPEKIEEFLGQIQSTCNKIKKQCSLIGKKQRKSLLTK